jgi:hypothetical protein
MEICNLSASAAILGCLFLVGEPAQAATLNVNCGASHGLNTIAAALRTLHDGSQRGPSTINVSGACSENIAIRGIDRLTISAVGSATVSDASQGTLDVIDISDTTDVTLNGLVVSGGAIGVACYDGGHCRINGGTVQGSTDGIGVFAGADSAVRVSGVAITGNSVGLQVANGGKASGDATIQGNSRGVHIAAGSLANLAGVISGNQELGVFETTNATFNCAGCTISGNAAGGVILRQGSSARFQPGFSISDNGGPGVLLSELSSALFNASGTVTGNAGGIDVQCGPQYTSARGATANIGGGATNCVEP